MPPSRPPQAPLPLLILLLPLLLISGCSRHPSPGAGSSPQKTFPLRGRVVATDPTGIVTLDHEAIPGYMEAMTMPYHLAAPNTISELHPGDRVTARLVLDQTRADDPSGYRNPRLDNVVVVAQARPDYKPAVQYHVPQAGDAVPDFHLLNQSARTLHLAQFHGKVLLLTFIYTRCPLADFCPRMSKNFADLDRDLAADPRLYAATHLLSISFDPSFDTPAVLHTYGAAYTGSTGFTHWDFAAPSAKDLPAVTQFFNVGVTPGDNPAALTHSLSTLLIGPDGKIVAWYPTNDWKPEEILNQVRALAKVD